MIIDLEYIRNYMNELDLITGFNSKDIELKISNRMTKCFAYNQMKWTDNKVLVNDKMVYSDAFLNCNAREEILKDIIKHEYCHAWADYGQKKSNSHYSDKYIAKCNILNCGCTPKCDDEELNQLYKKYLRECNEKKNLNKINYRKDVFDKMTRWVRHKYEVLIRLNVLETKGSYQINLTITEKYQGEEVSFLFDTVTRGVLEVLNKRNDINNITANGYDVDGIRKMNISYTHELNKLN